MGYDLKNSTINATSLTIPCISIPQAAGLSLISQLTQPATQRYGSSQTKGNAKAGSGTQTIQVTLQLIELPALDAAAVILFVMAVGTVIGGSLWSGADHAAAKRRVPGAQPQPTASSIPEQEAMDITPKQAALFVVVASAVLLTLFFLLSSAAFYVMLALFTIAGANGLTVLLAAGAELLLPVGARAVCCWLLSTFCTVHLTGMADVVIWAWAWAFPVLLFLGRLPAAVAVCMQSITGHRPGVREGDVTQGTQEELELHML